MYDIVLRDYMENPRTFIISSHNLTEIENLLSRMVFIDKGKLVFNKSMDDVQMLLIDVSGNDAAMADFKANLTTGALVKEIALETGNHLIVDTEADFTARDRAKELMLNVANVSSEDVCVYKNGSISEERLKTLWNNTTSEKEVL